MTSIDSNTQPCYLRRLGLHPKPVILSELCPERFLQFGGFESKDLQLP
jgi:hypothetical protein